MRTLTLERGRGSIVNPGQRVCMDWFHEVPNAEGKYYEPLRAEICTDAMDKYVTISSRTRYITIVASDRETPNCFNIRRNGRIKEIVEFLDCDFQKWLRKSYRRGERFVQVEIGK